MGTNEQAQLKAAGLAAKFRPSFLSFPEIFERGVNPESDKKYSLQML